MEVSDTLMLYMPTDQHESIQNWSFFKNTTNQQQSQQKQAHKPTTTHVKPGVVP